MDRAEVGINFKLISQLINQLITWCCVDMECRDCFQRVENLLSQKDTVKLVRDRPAQMEDARLDRNSHHSESDSDDVDFDEFLDWRAKRV